MNKIAQRLMDKNPAIVAALDAAPAKGQYKAVEPYITSRLCAKIGQVEGTYIKQQSLIWAIINVHNGEDESIELDY